MIRLNLFMIWFLHFLSLLSVICRCYCQNSSSRIIIVLVYTVSTTFINNVSSLTFQITMRSKPCFEKLKLYCIDSLFTDAEIISYIGNCRFNFSFIQSFNYILETIRERIQTLSSRSNIHQNLFAKFSQVIWQGFDFSQ